MFGSLAEKPVFVSSQAEEYVCFLSEWSDRTHWACVCVCVCESQGPRGDDGGPGAVGCFATARAGLHSWGYARATLPRAKWFQAESL